MKTLIIVLMVVSSGCATGVRMLQGFSQGYNDSRAATQAYEAQKPKQMTCSVNNLGAMSDLQCQ